MSRQDRLKEEIGWFKVAFGLLTAIDASLIAWVANHYSTVAPAILLLAVTATIVTSVAILLINILVFRHFRDLEYG